MSLLKQRDFDDVFYRMQEILFVFTVSVSLLMESETK